ncbi:hypothetical protein FHX10_004559 [Rhizobium sp. BK591]|uniref:hypothetical protein n=1 Tax=Rhizobium sp. BK591 TaxID=2586985 RepID=UPI001622726F|nr:hypothetical protein [Rhizobium sp. BK591]MBB3745022.1 hypothetical protein [Rhizobium sp. BK591]
MSNFLASAIPAETIMSDRLRIRMVDGDGMAPDLCGLRDYVMILPVDRYHCDGVYLVDRGFGGTLYRADRSDRRETPIRMRLDNPCYHRGADHGYSYFTLEKFNEMVLGFVVANIKVTNEPMLREAMGA